MNDVSEPVSFKEVPAEGLKVRNQQAAAQQNTEGSAFAGSGADPGLEEGSRKGPSEQRKIQQLMEQKQHPAQWVFALMLLLLSLWLLSNISEQAKFPPSKPFVSQPGFWPAISLIGMSFFSAWFLYTSWRDRDRTQAYSLKYELLAWVTVLEYPLWFLAYVWCVPQLGYLPSTLLFTLVMSLRLGYRKKGIYICAVLASIAIVVIFKAFLEVKIPGGAVYSYFPEAIRNFLILKL